jgi:hypothetical protein
VRGSCGVLGGDYSLLYGVRENEVKRHNYFSALAKTTPRHVGTHEYCGSSGAPRTRLWRMTVCVQHREVTVDASNRLAVS